MGYPPNGQPTETPSASPSEEPTPSPTPPPIAQPIAQPTAQPIAQPIAQPTENPTASTTEEPTPSPSEEPTPSPSEEPTASPSEEPTPPPTETPTASPSEEPTASPTISSSQYVLGETKTKCSKIGLASVGCDNPDSSEECECFAAAATKGTIVKTKTMSQKWLPIGCSMRNKGGNKYVVFWNKGALVDGVRTGNANKKFQPLCLVGSPTDSP